MAKKAAPKKSQREEKKVGPKAQDIFEDVYKPKIRMIGVGGGGSNIVAEIARHVGRLDFIAANTDVQALKQIARKNIRTFSFGEKLTQGLGCGMDVLLGEAAALADKEKILKLLEGQDLVILIASLGGGTGSGAAPVFLQLAKELKCLTIGVFGMPFSFEGEKRKQVAIASLEKLKLLVNSYVLIPNDNIFRMIEKNASFALALSSLNRKLAESLEGFVETLSLPGFINIDFADIQSLLEGKDRLAYLASATFRGAERAVLSLEQVMANPLLDYLGKGAERILLNISGGKDLKMQEVAAVSRAISQESPKAKIIFGITLGSAFEKKLRITLFAIGVQKEEGRVVEAHVQKHPPALKLPLRPRSEASRRASKKPVVKPKVQEVQKEKEQAPQIQFRRNALELHKAIKEEIEELQEQEKAWDIPAFLRAKRV